MIARFIILLLVNIPVTQAVLAEDCLAHTESRKLFSNHTELLYETLLPDTGRYSAVLKNGDFILARFATCGLGMSVHYFSVGDIDKNQLKDKLKALSNYILPSEVVSKKIIPQIALLTEQKLLQGAVVNGPGDRYMIQVLSSDTNTYRLHILYAWLPPEF